MQSLACQALVTVPVLSFPLVSSVIVDSLPFAPNRYSSTKSEAAAGGAGDSDPDLRLAEDDTPKNDAVQYPLRTKAVSIINIFLVTSPPL